MSDLDLQIRRAVLLVLAGSGCGSPEHSNVVVAVAAPGDAGSAPTVDAAPEPFIPRPSDPAEATCLAYRRSIEGTANDPRKQPKGSQRKANGHVSDYARKEPNGFVQCHIVWDRQTSEVDIMVSDPCCPSVFPRAGPCPRPHSEKATSEASTFETVIFNAQMKIISSKVEWLTYTPTPPQHMCGRRPEGFDVARDDGSLGAVLGSMAALEAASVFAFERLARELEHHGAPRSLVRRALVAAGDEVRHARIVRAIARGFGVRPRRVRRSSLSIRPRFEVAMENVVEGCVLETFGAAIATLQGERAEHAADAFRSIAVDERAHAVLSRDVHAWLSKQLTKRERAALDGARADAIASLPHASSSAEGRRLLGLPSADESRALAAVLF